MMNNYRYHHLGVPTTRGLPEEDYIPQLKCYASGFEESPYGIERMKFDNDCTMPEMAETVPHPGIVAETLDKAIEGKKVMIKPNSPTIRVNSANVALPL